LYKGLLTGSELAWIKIPPLLYTNIGPVLYNVNIVGIAEIYSTVPSPITKMHVAIRKLSASIYYEGGRLIMKDKAVPDQTSPAPKI